MTYRKLIDQLGRIPANRLDDDVTIYDSVNDEYMHNVSIKCADEDNDVLDYGHIFLNVD